MSDTPAPLVPAATVMLLRENKGRLETLLLLRNRSLKSFGGVWVFPGGRVDDDDGNAGDDEPARARRTACREAKEETGLDIDPGSLVSLSHWIPPIQEKRRFSTRFFLAAAPNKPVEIDQGEIHDFKWVCPKETIETMPNGDLRIMPPTYVSLFELSKFDTVEKALSGIAAMEDEYFQTKFAQYKGGFITLWEPDAAYETMDFTLPGPRRRLLAKPDGWLYIKEP